MNFIKHQMESTTKVKSYMKTQWFNESIELKLFILSRVILVLDLLYQPVLNACLESNRLFLLYFPLNVKDIIRHIVTIIINCIIYNDKNRMFLFLNIFIVSLIST